MDAYCIYICSNSRLHRPESGSLTSLARQLNASEKKSEKHNLTHAQELNLHLYAEQLTTSKDKYLLAKMFYSSSNQIKVHLLTPTITFHLWCTLKHT